MRKFTAVITSIMLIIFLTGCEDLKDTSSKTEVVINMPADSSVNGYRTSQPETSSQIPDVIKDSEATAGAVSNTSSITESDSIYCANKNSKVFHKSTCSSVKTIKEKNKLFSDNKATFTEQNYSPCKKCNP